MKAICLSLAAVVLLLSVSCSKNEPSTALSNDKRVTVSISNAASYDGKALCFALYCDTVPYMPIAFAVQTIAAGSASVTLAMPPDAYTVSVFIDLNGNNAAVKGAETGEPYAIDSIMLSADTSIGYDNANLIIDRRITVSLTGATDYAGMTFYCALFSASSPTIPVTADFKAIASGQASIGLAAPPGTYTIGAFIDMNSNFVSTKVPETGELGKRQDIILSTDMFFVYDIADLVPAP